MALWKPRSFLEDNPHKSGAKGQMGLAVRNDALTSLVDTDGDYAPLQVTAAGAVYTQDVNGANNVLATQVLIRATFIDAALASDGVLEIIPDPAAATIPKIVALVFTQTVQGLTEIRVTGVSGAIIGQYYRPAYDGMNLAMAEQPHLVGTVNESVVIKNKTGATCAYAGHVVWYLEA